MDNRQASLPGTAYLLHFTIHYTLLGLYKQGHGSMKQSDTILAEVSLTFSASTLSATSVASPIRSYVLVTGLKWMEDSLHRDEHTATSTNAARSAGRSSCEVRGREGHRGGHDRGASVCVSSGMDQGSQVCIGKQRTSMSETALVQ